MNHDYAVILAGGKGERFWPLSTSRRPKQLLALLGGETLITMAVDRLAGLVLGKVKESWINGTMKARLPGSLNFGFKYVEGESLLMGISEIAVSSGSACTSSSLEPSYVLKALGVNDELAHTSIRFGIGRFNTEEEIDYTIARVVEVVSRLREMSPLWEMVQEGIDLRTVNWTGH